MWLYGGEGSCCCIQAGSVVAVDVPTSREVLFDDDDDDDDEGGEGRVSSEGTLWWLYRKDEKRVFASLGKRGKEKRRKEQGRVRRQAEGEGERAETKRKIPKNESINCSGRDWSKAVGRGAVCFRLSKDNADNGAKERANEGVSKGRSEEWRKGVEERRS